MSALPKLPTTKDCADAECQNKFVQFNSLRKYCSGSCERKNKPSPLRAKTERKMKRREIKRKSKTPLTPEQKVFHARLREMGCAVGKFVYGKDGTPPDIHHIVIGNRRLGEGFVIPLCPEVHRQGTAKYPSIHSVNGSHGGKKAFKAAYGFDEFELLALCEKELRVKYSELN